MRRKDMTGRRQKALKSIQERLKKIHKGDTDVLKKSVAFRKGRRNSVENMADYADYLYDQATCLQEKLRGKP